MIERNVKINPLERGWYSLALKDPQLSALYKRFGGSVSVRIGKPIAIGTDAQNRACHALMEAYFWTELHSSPARDPKEFKLWLKFQIGVCYDYEYEGKPCRIPKSWARYSKEERRDFIEKLLSMIRQSGAESDQNIQQILQGMEENAKLR